MSFFLKAFLLLTVFLLAEHSFAQSNEPDYRPIEVLKVSVDRKRLVIPNDEEFQPEKDIFFIRDMDQKLNIKFDRAACKKTTCLVEILNPKVPSHILDTRKIYYIKKSKPVYKNVLGLLWGDPYGVALGGYVGTQWSRRWYYEGNLSLSKSDFDKTTLSGMSAGATALYLLDEYKRFKLNGGAMLNYTAATLKMTTSTDQVTFDEGIVAASLFMALTYKSSDRVLMRVDLGTSKTTTRETISTATGDFKNPYSNPLLYFSFKVGYLF